MLLPHVLLLFRHRYNPATHRAVAYHAGRAQWHLSMLIHTEDKPLAGLSSLQGVIIADHFSDAVVASILHSGVPVVNLTSDPETFAGARVTGDHEAIGRVAADCLLDRHHCHFAYYGDGVSVGSRLRHTAFAGALALRGHECLEIKSGSLRHTAVLDWADELSRLHAQLAEMPAPTAVFCYNDIHASRLLDAALHAGRLVPEEISILGVDDDPLICETASVPLSSVRHALEDVGTRGAEVLDSIMAGNSIGSTRLKLPPSGVTTRRSTDTFAVDNPVLQSILLHLDRNYHHPVGLPDVAMAAGVSPRTVQQLLHTRLGSTLTEEILKRRLAHAQRLLALPKPSITAIATTVGFASTTYFHHTFKRRTGQTPRQYRENALHPSAPIPSAAWCPFALPSPS